jgi:hypothetical protein
LRLLKKTFDKVSDYRYEAHNKKEALNFFKAVSIAQEKSLSPAIHKKCDEYAKEVFGSLKYSPWLRAYSVFAGTFKEGWIPSNYYEKIVVPSLKGAYGKMSQCKSMSSRIFDTDLIPDLVYSVNGLLYTTSMELIAPADLKDYLFENCEKVVYKLDSSLQGLGVFVYDKNTFPKDQLKFDNGVFQSYIVQHPFFDEFCASGVSTIRMTTVVDDKLNVQCRSAYLRFPRTGDSHLKSTSAVRVTMDKESGELNEKGYLTGWTVTTMHPDSKKAFLYQRIPNYKECLEEVISCHRKMPLPRVIGWDVIIDSAGKPVIIEWNGGHNGIRYSEAEHGPCFADLGWQELWKG